MEFVRRPRALVLAGLLCGGLLATLSVTAVDAKPRPPSPAAGGGRAAAADPNTITPGQYSAALPIALRDEATGQFTEFRYGQRVRAEGNPSGVFLNLYDDPAVGGSQLKSTPLDLNIAPDGLNEFGVPIPLFAEYANESTKLCKGCLDFVSEAYHFRTIYAATLAPSPYLPQDARFPIFVTGSKGDRLEQGAPNQYRNILYVVSRELTCAAENCVQHIDLPNYDGNVGRMTSVTSLAVGHVNGLPVVAVGLSQGGVMVFGPDLNLLGTFNGLANGDGSQAPITALAFDPAGSGLLAVGAMSHGSIGAAVQLNADGTVPSTYTTWAQQGGDDLGTLPLSVAIGRNANGKLVAGYGLNGGRLALVDPSVNSTNAVATFTFGTQPTAVSTVNAVPRIDGTSGGDDWAVAVQNGNTFGQADGALVRFTGTTGALLPLRPAAGNDDGTLLPSLDAFRQFFPGYKTGAVSLVNVADFNTGPSIQAQLFARPEGGYGCWYGPASGDAAQLPSGAVTLRPRDNSNVFTIGGYTAGANGLCGASDVSSARRGYVVFSVANQPGDARIVNLQLADDYTVDTSDQVGGAVTIDARTVQSQEYGPYGELIVDVTPPAPPAFAAAPTVSGKLLTLADRARNAIYRVDVGPVSWSVPGAGANQQQAVLPPLPVQASLDGTTWTNVGQFMPVNTLNQSGSTVTSGNVATGSGSFYWENPSGAPNYTQLRVLAGAFASTPVVLNKLAPPAVPTRSITSITVTPAKSALTTATPAANGVDQAPLSVAVSAGGTLPPSDAAYASVYYRDEDDNLVTNLYAPGAFDDFLGVQPNAGAYPNTGSVSRRRGAAGSTTFDYVSVAGSIQHKVQAYVGTAASSVRSGQVSVQGTALDIAPDPNAKASVGFSLEGCADYANSQTCQLAVVTPGSRPALYQAGDSSRGPRLGAQLRVQARNALSDLPLQWTPKVTQLKLASSPVAVTATRATMTDRTNFVPNYDVDTWLVSHGALIPITALPVGGS